MIKPIANGFIAKLPSVTQIYKGNKMVNIFNNGEKVEKTYIDTTSMKIIRKVIEWLNKKQ